MNSYCDVFIETSSLYIKRGIFKFLFNSYFQWIISIASVEKKSCFFFAVIIKVDDVVLNNIMDGDKIKDYESSSSNIYVWIT